ncbi:hypothetical protein BRD02_12155 [Halobacteriales archaeon QS_8_69_73]|nr:MAG: hypothetical protein BRD02_12155 [Halobacteriales archaeon QS_8_69_73]
MGGATPVSAVPGDPPAPRPVRVPSSTAADGRQQRYDCGTPTPAQTETRRGVSRAARGGTARLRRVRRRQRTASATYEAGSRARCDADGEIFGVDRGATRGGYETDETLQNNINSIPSGENGLVVEFDFDGDGDIGASTYLDDGDEVVSVTGRIDDSDEPGWYQVTATTGGVTADGEEATFRSIFHYFCTCDCEGKAVCSSAHQGRGSGFGFPAALAGLLVTAFAVVGRRWSSPLGVANRHTER